MCDRDQIDVLDKEVYKSYSDEQVVTCILEQNNPELFRILYNRYSTKVYHKCLSFTSDSKSAEDLAHDVLLKVYLSIRKFSGRSRFSTWLYSITYNACVDHRRKQDKRLQAYQEYGYAASQESDDTSDHELYQIQVEQLRKLLEAISPEDKALLLMRYQDELPIKNEIMEITNLTEGAVKMRIKRAKEKIVRMSKESH